jgi:heptosyltransferase-2
LLQRLIRATDLQLLLVGGEAEGARLDRLAEGLPVSRIEIARQLPLPDLARRLAGAGAFVGHDSGISHLAAALGLPTLVLWGETSDAVWRPLGERVQILRAEDGLHALAVVQVAESLQALLAARGQG